MMSLILILGAGLIFAGLAELIKMPAVVGLIVAGLVLGPAGLDWVQVNSAINGLAQLGVILIMFLAGLESDLELLKRYAKPAVWAALGGMLLPIAVFASLGLSLGWSAEIALFWGVLFSATSVAISAQVLAQYQQLDSRPGVVIMGAAVVDDLLAVLAWGVFASSFGLGNASGNLAISLVVQLVFLVVLVMVAWLILPRLVAFIRKYWSLNLAYLFILVSVFGLAELAEHLGSSAVIAAFLLGLGLSSSKFEGESIQKIAPVSDLFFAPVFFVSIGLKMSLAGLGHSWAWIGLLTVLAIATKLIGAGGLAYWHGLNQRESLTVGIGMVSRGEMALIIADLGLGFNLINGTTYTILAVVILLTTVFTPLALRTLLAPRR
ncbi:cation:proton antiporter [Lactobacillaceae bacterium L1_55_11]|nr:cation:proton antiporter [Lactobacillaceae bacterium L1_55_11]